MPMPTQSERPAQLKSVDETNTICILILNDMPDVQRDARLSDSSRSRNGHQSMTR